jgi:arsenate reductase-like glutaredoxin family protein
MKFIECRLNLFCTYFASLAISKKKNIHKVPQIVYTCVLRTKFTVQYECRSSKKSNAILQYAILQYKVKQIAHQPKSLLKVRHIIEITFDSNIAFIIMTNKVSWYNLYLVLKHKQIVLTILIDLLCLRRNFQFKPMML